MWASQNAARSPSTGMDISFCRLCTYFRAGPAFSHHFACSSCKFFPKAYIFLSPAPTWCIKMLAESKTMDYMCLFHPTICWWFGLHASRSIFFLASTFKLSVMEVKMFVFHITIWPWGEVRQAKVIFKQLFSSSIILQSENVVSYSLKSVLHNFLISTFLPLLFGGFLSVSKFPCS